jgi:hypothetical protein
MRERRVSLHAFLLVPLTFCLLACDVVQAPTQGGGSWQPAQETAGPGWQLEARERGPQDGAVGTAVLGTTQSGVKVAITVPPGGPGCNVPVFAGLIESTPDEVQARIERKTDPAATGGHCLSTANPVVFRLVLAPRPRPYFLVLADTVSCQPTCGDLKVYITP